MAKKTKIVKAFNLDITTAGDKSLPETGEEELQRRRRTKRESKSERAGLVLPVARTWRYLKRKLIKRRIRLDAAVRAFFILFSYISKISTLTNDHHYNEDLINFTKEKIHAIFTI